MKKLNLILFYIILAVSFSGAPLFAIVYSVPLSVEEEVPAPVLGAATPSGQATVEVDTLTGEVSITGEYTGMSSEVTAAHLHGLAPRGVASGVLIPLNTTGGTSGEISGEGTLSESELEGLSRGMTYVNVHTANNAPGEIRGQVVSADVRAFAVGLSADEEVPAPSLGGAEPTGEGRVVVQLSTGEVEIAGSYDGMSSNVSGSHLHGLASVGTTAGVLFGLDNTGGTSGTFSGRAVLDEADLGGLLTGRTYLNIHTSSNGPGEIRGQVADNKIRVFEIPLEAEQEVPAATLNGSMPTGSATVRADILTGAVSVTGDYSGMTSNVGAAHLHGLAPRGTAAGVLFGLSTSGGQSGSFSGSGMLSSDDLEGFLAGRTYVNVHTAQNGAGEIRGQVEFQLADLPPVRLVPVLEDAFLSPVGLTHAGDGSGRLFVVEQRGQVRIVMDDGSLLPDPFLDLGAKLVPERNNFDERGLLGLAFHPDYGTVGAPGEGKLYVYYSAPSPNAPGTVSSPVDHMSVVAEYEVSTGDSNVVNPASERILLSFDQPQFNHDAGQVAFGPDGLLYIATGDGGSSEDNDAGHTGGNANQPPAVLGNAQDRSKFLGKILRIDPLGSDGPGGLYSVPADNPFVGEGGGVREEIFAYGLRNPWRFSFDHRGPGATGRLFVADVGQRRVEEINLVEKGKNYGWRAFEGTFDFDPATPAEGPFEPPIAEYTRPGQDNGLPKIGISVTGGYVYRGGASPALHGLYLFGDWSSSFGMPNGTLLGLIESQAGQFDLGIFEVDGGNPIGRYLPAFGRDEAGEIYLATKRTLAPSAVDPDSADPTGSIFRIATGGEIRHFEVSLTPDQEIPAPTLDGASPSGSAVVEVDAASGRVSVAGTYRGMTSTVSGSHLHGLASSEATAGVLFGLDNTGGTSGRFWGSAFLSQPELEGLLSGMTYLNIHTTRNGSGEIRAQVPGIIVEDPRLSVTLEEGGGVSICWDDPTGALVLQESTDLRDWERSERSIEDANGKRCITIAEPAGRLFFRLR